MQRRDILAALTSLVLTTPGAVWSQTSARGCYRGQDNLVRCSVGFADPPPIPVQECRAHCWATSLAYVMRGFGAEVTTEDVLARQGAGDDCTPHHGDLARLGASAGFWRDRQGRAFLLAVSPLPRIDQHFVTDSDFSAMLDRLERQPLLCGAAGHTTVLMEVHTASDRFGRVWREGARVIDPFGPYHGIRALTAEELARPAYVLGVSVRPL